MVVGDATVSVAYWQVVVELVTGDVIEIRESSPSWPHTVERRPLHLSLLVDDVTGRIASGAAEDVVLWRRCSRRSPPARPKRMLRSSRTPIALHFGRAGCSRSEDSTYARNEREKPHAVIAAREQQGTDNGSDIRKAVDRSDRLGDLGQMYRDQICEEHHERSEFNSGAYSQHGPVRHIPAPVVEPGR